LPEGMLEEASKHGWPLPAPGRYPSLARIADGAPAKVTRSDFQLLLALARALTAFSREHAEALESYGELPVRETYADRDGLELVLTVPHPEVDLDDLQEPPRAQTLPGVHNPYGLPLSKKELAQLDKALGSFTLDRLIGVFCAVVSVPATLPPKRWMAMIAPSVKVADAVEFRALSDAMLRAYNHVAERMQAWSIAELVPVSAAPEACRAWARGYVSVCDEVELPEQKGELVDSLFGVYVAAEVPRYLTILDAHLEGATRAEHIAQRQELLADDVAYLYEGWERARRETAERALAKPVPIKVAPKAGRNDPCPCGSGKKHKKCCA
ncbi:MAG: yecA family protein, partial [Myxococcaceae bacterium]|nr:yecA family protein [Myxococcaceae bacterium]